MSRILPDTPAEMAKLVDALALGASAARHGSSSLPLSTNPLRKPALLQVFRICEPQRCFSRPKAAETARWAREHLADEAAKGYEYA